MMKLEEKLANRSENKCELCGSANGVKCELCGSANGVKLYEVLP
jgi:ribosomal protein S14